MPIDRVVINASPLITLFRAGLHPLLPKLFSELLVPEAVWDEVVNRTYDDPATRGLPQSVWARKTATTVAPAVAVWSLGAGETAVLSLSLRSLGLRPSSTTARQGAALAFRGCEQWVQRKSLCLPSAKV
jgi:predicted nucleic acid-binding protein